ncbi:hypothetical protein B0H10DRAFT_1361437 [Mycena sp. CBHHK59/15]|nr:hypothetical protein B0H10DRAFT_1361437 [Mycena sp. CBHHK59/15]
MSVIVVTMSVSGMNLHLCMDSRLFSVLLEPAYVCRVSIHSTLILPTYLPRHSADQPSASQPESEAMSISSGSLVSAYHFEDSLYLHWEGGYEGRAVLIELICDPKESGYPTFSNATGTLHVFTWRTKYGCSLDTFHALDSESEQPPADANPEPSDTDEEQLLEGSKQMNSRRSTAIVFLVASTIIITLSIISYKHPRMFNLLLTEYIKPVFYRLPLDIPPISIPNLLKPTGEGRLVRWAQEDLELDEDFVNAHDAEDDVEAGGLDEYIPLRPSPRKGGRSVKNYGSATSPFW